MIIHSILALAVSGAPTPLENSAPTSIKNARPKNINPRPVFLNKLISPCGLLASLNHNAPRTGPNTIHTSEFNESNQARGTSNPPTFMFTNAAP